VYSAEGNSHLILDTTHDGSTTHIGLLKKCHPHRYRNLLEGIKTDKRKNFINSYVPVLIIWNITTAMVIAMAMQ